MPSTFTTTINTLEFDDARGRFPDRISVNTPKGLRSIAREVAKEQSLSLGEFVRRALARAIESAGAKAPQSDAVSRKQGFDGNLQRS
jgi:hypothetical protein